MMIEKSAKSVDEAVKLALGELGITEQEADIEILEQPSKGFLGVIGGKNGEGSSNKKSNSIRRKS